MSGEGGDGRKEARSRSRRTLLLSSAMLGNLLAGLAGRMFQVALPTIAEALHTDLVGVSWALVSQQVAVTSLSPVAGRMGDVYGRRRLYAVGFVAMSVGAFLCGGSSDVYGLVVYRTLQGVGAALIQATARVLAMDAMGPGGEGRASGFMNSAFQTGLLVGPAIGAVAIEWIGWRWVFFALVPVGLAGAVLALVSLGYEGERRGRPGAGRLDGIGGALFVVVMVLLTLVVSGRGAEMAGSFWQWAAGLGLVVAFVGLIWNERRVANPILPFKLFRNRAFGLSALALFSLSVTHGTMGLIMPFYLQQVLRLSPAEMGAAFMISPILTMAASPFAGSFTDRVGARVPATLGACMTVLAYGVASALGTESHVSLAVTALGLVGLGVALFTTPNHAVMISSVDQDQRGVAAGMIQTTFGLAHFVGVALGGAMLNRMHQLYVGSATSHLNIAGEPGGFVWAASRVYGVLAGLSLLAVACSILRGDVRASSGSAEGRRVVDVEGRGVKPRRDP